jgi:hypothetical protein
LKILSRSDSCFYEKEKKKKKKKKLDVFNQITQNLEKYMQSASQDEFLDYYIRNLYNIEKMTALE